MNTHNQQIFRAHDKSNLIVAFLHDMADRPVQKGKETRLAEIRQAAAQGYATDDMVIDVLRFYPQPQSL